jgi:hypothetical protein
MLVHTRSAQLESSFSVALFFCQTKTVGTIHNIGKIHCVLMSHQAPNKPSVFSPGPKEHILLHAQAQI